MRMCFCRTSFGKALRRKSLTRFLPRSSSRARWTSSRTLRGVWTSWLGRSITQTHSRPSRVYFPPLIQIARQIPLVPPTVPAVMQVRAEYLSRLRNARTGRSPIVASSDPDRNPSTANAPTIPSSDSAINLVANPHARDTRSQPDGQAPPPPQDEQAAATARETATAERVNDAVSSGSDGRPHRAAIDPNVSPSPKATGRKKKTKERWPRLRDIT